MNAATHHGKTGFTLVEVLVSMSVFVLLVIVITQLFNSATAVTIGGNKHLDADTEARLVLDRMAIDFAHIVKRSDVDYYFQKNDAPAPNDQMAFFSESTGYYPSAVTGPTAKSNVSLIGYRIYNNQLQRLSKALIWNGVTNATTGIGTNGLAATDRPMVFLPQTIATTWPNITESGTDADYQVIGDQVYRLEICFLVKTGTQNAVLSDKPYAAPDTTYNGLQDVAAIVVAIGVLDTKSRMLVNASTLTASANKLEDVDGATITSPPATVWQTDIQNGIQNGTIGLPRTAAAQIRVYQRYFYLDQSP